MQGDRNSSAGISRNPTAPRLAQILANPILCVQTYLRNRDGRDVGKSVCISTDVLYFAFTTHGGRGLIAAPHQGHLDTLVEEIEYQLDSNPDLMASIALTKYGKQKIHRKPYFRLEFTNGEA